MGERNPDTVDFGFREVPRAEKARLVRGVFDSVAPRYDLMNDLMSLGVHRAWKRIFVNAIGAGPRDTLLDLAAGTGDVGFLARGRGAGRVVLSDVNPAMLSVAQGRALDRGIADGVLFLCAVTTYCSYTWRLLPAEDRRRTTGPTAAR